MRRKAQFMYKGTSSVCFADTFPMLMQGKALRSRRHTVGMDRVSREPSP